MWTRISGSVGNHNSTAGFVRQQWTPLTHNRVRLCEGKTSAACHAILSVKSDGATDGSSNGSVNRALHSADSSTGSLELDFLYFSYIHSTIILHFIRPYVSEV